MRKKVISIVMIGMFLLISLTTIPVFGKEMDNKENIKILNETLTKAYSSGLSDGPDIDWDGIYYEEEYATAKDIIQTEDGGYLIAGEIYKNSFDAFLLKLDSNGDVEWENNYSAGRSGIWILTATFNKIYEESDGYVVGGYKQIPYIDEYGDNLLRYYLWIVKVDFNGDILWEETDGILDAETRFKDMEMDYDGGYILAGVRYPHPDVQVLTKFNTNGEKEWNKSIYVDSITGLTDCDIDSIRKTSDGGYILYGRSIDSWFEPDSWMVKLNSQFEYDWHKIFTPDDHGARFQDLAVNENGDFVFSLGWGEIVKTDGNGNISWNEKYLNPEVQDINCINVVENDGIETGYIAIGTVNIASWDIWVNRVDLFGNTLWTKKFDSSSIFDSVDEEGMSIKPTSDGGFILAGDKYDGIWIIKLEPEGETISYKPEKPGGPSQGESGIMYTYTTSAKNPYGKKMEFGWDWNGDRIVDEWDDNNGNYYESDEVVRTDHSWTGDGAYLVRVIARDNTYEELSGWSDDLEVIMPKAKSNVFPKDNAIFNVLEFMGFKNLMLFLESLNTYIYKFK